MTTLQGHSTQTNISLRLNSQVKLGLAIQIRAQGEQRDLVGVVKIVPHLMNRRIFDKAFMIRREKTALDVQAIQDLVKTHFIVKHLTAKGNMRHTQVSLTKKAICVIY